MEYALRDAKRLEWAIDNAKPINPFEVPRALKLLAQINEERLFCSIVDGYAMQIALNPSSFEMGENPHSYIEYLCAGMDQSFSAIGYGRLLGRPDPALGITQSYFQRFYGRHF